jgi:hypothetical protein
MRLPVARRAAHASAPPTVSSCLGPLRHAARAYAPPTASSCLPAVGDAAVARSGRHRRCSLSAATPVGEGMSQEKTIRMRLSMPARSG